MIPVRSLAKKEIGVLGLARSGLATVAAAIAGGAKVYAWDDKEAPQRTAAQSGATVAPYAQWPWDRLAALVLSPGIPLTHPVPHEIVRHAEKHGVKIIGDMELFAAEIRSDPALGGIAPVIAITGTNGKSTTTALIGHILSQTGFDAQVGGNIGKPVLELEPAGPKTVYVLEVSSYQVDLSPGLVPDFAILSNITPDHIDRHGTIENYAGVKTRLLKQTTASGQVAIGVDSPMTSAIFTKLSSNGGAQAIAVSVGKVLGRGIFVVDGEMYDATNGRTHKVMDLSAAENLPGTHNWQNAALAYAATKSLVKDPRSIAAAIASFPGLPHRIENVGRIGKTRFINDSKATNAEAAERAIVCYPDIFWIAGGKAKDGGIESLAPHFKRIRKAFLIGDAAEGFARTLEGKVAFEISGTLEKATAAAAREAAISSAPSPVVLLSPACASFDQFRDFEQRGDVFRQCVAKLSGEPVREAS